MWGILVLLLFVYRRYINFPSLLHHQYTVHPDLLRFSSRLENDKRCPLGKYNSQNAEYYKKNRFNIHFCSGVVSIVLNEQVIDCQSYSVFGGGLASRHFILQPWPYLLSFILHAACEVPTKDITNFIWIWIFIQVKKQIFRNICILH